MDQVVCAIITTYLLVLFARAILSWLPPSAGIMATINRVLLDLTEPVLAPMRRVIPATGVFDLSFLVLMFGLFFVRSAVCAQ